MSDSRQFIIFNCKMRLRTFDSSIIIPRPSRTEDWYWIPDGPRESLWWLMWNFDILRKPAPTINKSSLPTFNFKFSSCNLLKWTYLGVCIFYCFIVNFKIFWAFNVIIWRIVLGYKSYIAMNHKNSPQVCQCNMRDNQEYNDCSLQHSSPIPSPLSRK